MIRVLVADDQSLICSALAAMLGLEDDIEVVGQASTTAEAIRLAEQLKPDVILMDVQMPDGGGPSDGIDASAQVLKVSPLSRIIIVTTFGRPGYLRRAMEAGAVGFMVKDAPAERLIEAIRSVAQGLRIVDPELAAASLSMGANPLSEKETQVLRACRSGATAAEIAKQIFLSEGTIRNYLSSAIGKLEAANRAEVIYIATENGWL
ncbi:MAG: response regulator transcription factor [Propionibacteriaceae bacterium]